jgi:hypothetical protein
VFVVGRRFRRLRREAWVGVFVLAGLVCLSVVGLQSASPAVLAPGGKVRICHASSSQSDPYTSQEPTVGNNGDLSGGHLNHTGPVFPAADWGDIIPPYTYVDANGDPRVFPGYNWTPEGQAIWQYGCTPGKESLTPILECVEATDGGFLAHFGYDNPNAEPVVEPFENAFTPPPADRGQPTAFAPGRVKDAFQVESNGGPLTWTLTGNHVMASKDSRLCAGSLTIVKVLNPSDDAGRFNLEIGGVIAGGGAAVGDGGTTGTIAVSAGPHIVGESAAPGTSLARYDTQIVCLSAGAVVAESNSATLTVRVQNEQAIECTITNTRKQQPKPVVPILECVVFKNGAPERAVWGYRNDNAFPAPIPISSSNSFAPAPADRGQPTLFEPGRWTGIFETPFNGAATLTWTLAGQTLTASSTSDRCSATLELRKATVPASDPGLFNLLVNGTLLASGGNGTTTGPISVGVGEGTISELAAPGTNLTDYQSTVDCTRNGVPVLSVSGTKADGAVANGDVVVCTFTNQRLAQPPPTPPTPPGPPGDQVDLAIVKTATPTTVVLGQNITWTVTVTNKSAVDAPDVNVVKASERSYRTKLISLTPSQGTCTSTGCDLGRIAPGASATITAVTEATRIGAILNVVRVGSEEQESDYLNNTAAALVRVVGPLRPPPKPVCRTLAAAPHALLRGQTLIVLTTARNRFGAPVRGLTVRMRGPGVNGRAKTNRLGIARFTVTPSNLGLVFFRGAVRTPAARAAPCATFLAVLKSSTPSVTG